MSDAPAADASSPPKTEHRWRRAAIFAVAGVAFLAALLVAGLFILDTRPGHQLLTTLVARLQPANGLRIEVGGIEGSIYRRATLKGVVLRDPDGAFLTAPSVTLDWRAAALLRKHLDVRRLDVPTMSLLRRPHFRPTPPKPFTLPDLAITVGRLNVGRLILEAPVTGQRRVATLAGGAVVGHGRIQVTAAARTLDLDDGAGGDRLALDIDASPRANRLKISADLTAPAGGVVDRLANVGGALTAHVGGRGDWRDWRGALSATFAGQPLVAADLTATSGRMRLAGQAHPGLILKGPLATLTTPSLAFEVRGTMLHRIADGSITLRSAPLAIDATGRLDLASGAFDKVRLDATLSKPEALGADIVGRDVTLGVRLDGSFASPQIDYDLKAASLGYGAYVAQTLHAAGRGTSRRAGDIDLPIHATAARLSGLDPSLASLGTHIRLDGELRVSATQIATDNLRLRSDHIDATLVMAAALDTGRYSATFKGKVEKFRAPGLGVVDLATDAKLTPTGRGRFAIAGHVRATATQFENTTLRDLFGGPAVLTGDLSRSPAGRLALDRLQLTAPAFELREGRGAYDPDGALSFTARAVSDRYGSAALTVTGTAKAPTARLTADRLTLGAPLTAVDVRLAPERGGYAIEARAESPYGPLRVDAGLLTAARPLVIDVRRASLESFVAQGHLTQTATGPFAGTLQISGGGLSGPIRLSAAGKAQRLEAALAAVNARLPLTPPVTIGRGRLDATAILGPGGPNVRAAATASRVRRADLAIASAQLEVDYAAGHGTAALTAAGAAGAPFTLRLSGVFDPQAIRIDGEGSIKGQTLRLAEPAQIHKAGKQYRLDPATLLLPNGALRVAGAYGKGAALDLQLSDVDLGLANAFKPDLLIGGKANGTVSFTFPARRGAGPAGRLRLQIANFTRAGLNRVSEPVDVALLGTLADPEGTLSAVVRRRGAVIGRTQLQLKAAAGDAGDWLQRFKLARVSGGLRYNGPAETLWSLSGVAGQQLSGPVAIGADVSGRLDAPQLQGIVSSKALRYENAKFGTVLTALAIDGTFSDTRFALRSIAGRTPGGGAVAGSGSIDLSSAKGFPINLKFALRRAVVARGDGLDATVSGTLAVTNGKTGALISGDLSVDQARYAIANSSAAEVPILTGVRRKGEPLRPLSTPGESTGPPSVWKLDVQVRADNQVFVSGLGLDAEWRSDLSVRGDASHPVIVGDIRLVRGTYAFAGRRLALTRGIIHLGGSHPPNPSLDLEASAVVDGVTATIDILGTATNPRISFTSSPGLPQDEVLSRLLFGRSVAAISPVQAVQLAASLNALRGSGSGLNPLGRLRQASGLDSLRFSGAGQGGGRGPAVGAGRYLGDNVYVEITTDARGFTATQIEIALSKTLRLLSQVSSFGGSNISLEYSKEY